MADERWGKFKQASGFMKFAEIGDAIEGTIRRLEFGPFGFDEAECPQLTIETEDGTTQVVTASQRVLMSLLAEKEPEEGDRIRIAYVGDGPGKPGRAPSKLFEVIVEKAGSTAPVEASDLTGGPPRLSPFPDDRR